MPRTISRKIFMNTAQDTEILTGELYMLEQGAHVFEITCLKDRGGEAAQVSGTVTGRFIRADGQTELVSGSLLVNVASVTLTQNCYNVPGPFGLVVFITESGVTTAIWSCQGTVKRSTTDSVIDSGSVIPTPEQMAAAIAACTAAAASASNAASAITGYTAAGNGDPYPGYNYTAEGVSGYWKTYTVDSGTAASSTISDPPSSYPNTMGISIPVVAGDEFEIAAGVNASSIRELWAVIGSDRKTIVRANHNFIGDSRSAPVTVRIPTGGAFLLVNYDPVTYPGAYVVKTNRQYDVIGSRMPAGTKTTAVATRAIASGEVFLANNRLYKATAAIAADAEIVPGTNCAAFTVAEGLTTAAADSAKLSALYDSVYSPITLSSADFTAGYYNQNTGSVNSSDSTWMRTSSLFYAQEGTTFRADSSGAYKYMLAFYRSGTAKTSTFVSSAVLKNIGYEYTLPFGAYVGVSAAYDNGSSPDASAFASHIDICVDNVRALGQLAAGACTVYVGPSGSDSNDGTIDAPFATLAKAAGVSDNIRVLPGVYHERVQLTMPRQTLNISGYPDTGRAFFDQSEILTCTTVTDGVAYIPYTAETSDYLYRVFVTQDVLPTAGSSAAQGKDYKCQIWSTDGAIQYIPVVDSIGNLSDGQWTYDGTNIMIKGASAGQYRLSGRTVGAAVYIQNVTNLVIANVDFGYNYSVNLDVDHCENYTLDCCTFSHSSTGSGVGLSYSNGVVRKCRSMYNCNDGFSFHDFGQSTIVDCEGGHNAAGDGISHHQCCTSTIIGGRWHHNGKAGISDPTYGADVNIYNAVCHDNAQFGIQVALSSGGGINNAERPVIVDHCLMYNNPVGITVGGYTVLLVAPVFSGNTADKTTSSGGVITQF